jgi:5-formyltetrahydrofolate cyclo-ligase
MNPNPESISMMARKAVLRRTIREVLVALSPATRDAANAALRQRIVSGELWQSATRILLFAPLPDEPNIWPLLATALAVGKTVALPRFDPATGGYVAAVIRNPAEEIVTGRFDVREPRSDCEALPLNRLDLILVPGVAFDRQCRRLGRGKGFYDRLLAAVTGSTCGVAFDQQLVDEIPTEPHDVPLNCILTPSHRLVRPPCATGE